MPEHAAIGRPTTLRRADRRRYAARVAVNFALALAASALGIPGPAAAATIGPYFGASLRVTRLPFGFGQDPSWSNDGLVLSAQNDAAGITQIYRARPDGSRQVCLTCRTVTGPNGLPQARPTGGWIMFESFGAQPDHVGGPGLGGYGGDLYVMHPDGTHAYRLTTTSDPDGGRPFTVTNGVPYDNFHAYWSPDGRHVAWTHTEANPLRAGGQTWEMLLGDFTVVRGVPSLRRVRVIGRPYGAYETQPWSPDGRGFLFFASGGYRSPFQTAAPGWGNARVYYMRVYGPGASPARPRVTRIGDNAPFYEEQSLFTPDMRTVIVMSNRGRTIGSWYGAVAAAAQRTRYDAPDTGTTQTLQFLADFDGPDFSSDLFAVDLRSGATRRLTYLDRVIPEFYWDHAYARLIWGMGGSQTSATYTARFAGIGPAQRRVPRRAPPWLYGQPVDMGRVGAQAQPVRDPGPTDDRPVAVAPPVQVAPALPHRSRRGGGEVPAVVATYLGPWTADLAALGARSAQTFSADPFGRLGLG